MDISKNMSKMLNPFAKPASAPQATVPVFAGGAKTPAPVDQRDMFKAQLKSGQINFNPDKPALPHFASKSWTA